MPTTEYVTALDGTRVGYLQQCAGPGIVLIQGAMADVHAYRKLAAALSYTFTVYTAERRGRGLSPRPYDNNHDIARDVEDIDAILTQTNSRVIFGLSSGAVITLEAASTLENIPEAIVFEPPFYSQGMDHTGVARLNDEIEAGDLPSALVDALLVAGTAPAIIRKAPRPLCRLLAKAFIAVNARSAGPASTFQHLLPGVRYDFHDVAQMDGHVDNYAGLSKPVLLLSGSNSPEFILQACCATC